MELLIDLNIYLHDFTSAMWVCGSILMWMLMRDATSGDASRDVTEALYRFAVRLRVLTIPSLCITLASGGIRAATFSTYEHAGPITTSVIVFLIIKHIAFAAFVAWGVWIHWKSRVSLQPATEH